jgi:sulfate permease, SulP family
MNAPHPPNAPQGLSTFVELFTPKLVTVLREGYRFSHLRADLVAGLTVAIVALPLSLAIAIASGVSPAQGLYTAIVGGFLVSALGGSRFQIGGPAGAFIVLIAATVAQHGVDGMILAVLISGAILVVAGFARIGTYIKFIPYPVTVGFTAGIAVIILASQISALLGLVLPAPEPAALVDKLPVLWSSITTFDTTTVALALATIAVIVALRRIRPHWPGLLIAVAGAATATALFNLPVATIGTEYGGIPSGLPPLAVPEITVAKLLAVLPNAIGFALLGAIESLLSAVVADGMTGRRHRSNCELVGQGIANVASGLVGGIAVTGTIARTATNVRAGAHGPVAGMLHALFLLAFVLIAAPLASWIPLASLAGVLAVVAWSMVEKQAFATLLRASAGSAAVLMVTFLLTVFRDLTEAIVVGSALGSILFIHRLSQMTAVDTHLPFVAEDKGDAADGGRGSYDESTASNPGVIVYRISGVFFFGAAASIGAVLERVADPHRALVIDFAAVPFLDATAANTIEGLARKVRHRGVKVVLTGTTHAIREELFAHDVKPPLVTYERNVDVALRKLKAGG